MSLTPEKVIEVATKEVGYKETGTNRTKYAQELDSIKYYNYPKNGIAWCAVFTDHCIYVASGKNKTRTLQASYQPTKDNCGAGALESANYFKSKKQFFTTPRVGDKVFFYVSGKIGHVGLVAEVSSSKIVTIEGNKGNCVKKCTYKLSDKSIAGFGRVKYDKVEDVKPVETVNDKTEPITPVTVGTTYTVKTNTGDTLRIRQNANTSSKQLGTIPNKKSFTSDLVVKGQNINGCDKWVKATYNGVTGYVSGKYLTPTPVITELKEEPVKGATYKVVTNSGVGLRIRNKPNTSGVQIGLIPNGTKVTVFSTSNGWCYLEYKGVKGYSSSTYLKKV